MDVTGLRLLISLSVRFLCIHVPGLHTLLYTVRCSSALTSAFVSGLQLLLGFASKEQKTTFKEEMVMDERSSLSLCVVFTADTTWDIFMSGLRFLPLLSYAWYYTQPFSLTLLSLPYSFCLGVWVVSLEESRKREDKQGLCVST